MSNILNHIKKSVLVMVSSFVFTTAVAQQFPDSEIKKNISGIDNPLQKVILLEPKEYEYDTKNFKHLRLQPGRQYGFMAENVQAVFPRLVSTKQVSYMFGKNSYRDASIKTIDEAGLVPILVAAIKEQQAAIEQLKADIITLKSGKSTVSN